MFCFTATAVRVGAAIVAAFLALVFGVIAMCVGWSSIHLESLDEILIPGVGVVVHPLLPMSLISGEIVPVSDAHL